MMGLIQTERTRVVQVWKVSKVCVVGHWYAKYAPIHTGMNWYVQYKNVVSQTWVIYD